MSGSAKKFTNNLGDSNKFSDDIVDEIGSEIEESIKESIDSSGKLFGKSSYEDFKAKQFKNAVEDSTAMTTLLS